MVPREPFPAELRSLPPPVLRQSVFQVTRQESSGKPSTRTADSARVHPAGEARRLLPLQGCGHSFGRHSSTKRLEGRHSVLIHSPLKKMLEQHKALKTGILSPAGRRPAGRLRSSAGTGAACSPGSGPPRRRPAGKAHAT